MIVWEPKLNAEAEGWRAIADVNGAEVFGPAASHYDQEQIYPHSHVQELVRTRLAAMFVPSEYGGRGASLTATIAAIETISSYCASTAAIMGVYQLGAFPILLAGTEEQKQTYLQALAEGHATSFALSERAAGSDASGIQTTATPEGDGWRLRGEKYWIGNGGISRYYVVFAKIDGQAGRGITPFIVDSLEPGVVVTEVVDKMGLRATQTSNLVLDTWVPASAMVGAPGKGMRLASQTLNVGRLTVSAQATGLALTAYREACSYAVQRVAFGQPIVDFQGTGFKLADIATELSAARLMLYTAAAAYDNDEPIEQLAAMTKLYASEMSHRTVDRAVQVLGGRGYCKPSPVERLYRDQRIIEIYEGSSEIQRLMLTRMISAQTTHVLSTQS
jgi:alkylation response protein AidB-like acyl-CoA dehydrogenase